MECAGHVVVIDRSLLFTRFLIRELHVEPSKLRNLLLHFISSYSGNLLLLFFLQLIESA